MRWDGFRRALWRRIRRAAALPAVALLVLLAGTAACGDAAAGRADSSSTAEARTATDVARTATAGTPTSQQVAQLVALRLYRLVEPADDNAQEPAPLIVVLHGYGQGSDYDTLGLDELAEREGALVVHPEGTFDGIGRRFWNAFESCCNFFGQAVDDVAYVRAVIDDVSARRAVDGKRVYIAGFSNGAFMAHRMACELPDRIAAIVAVSGVNASAPGQCQPAEPVAVLQVHGDADPIVHYLGGQLGGAGAPAYPSAVASIEGWRERNECEADADVRGAALDAAPLLPGRETSVMRYTGCKDGGAAELWTVHGGSHDIEFSTAFGREVWRFLAEHPKP